MNGKNITIREYTDKLSERVNAEKEKAARRKKRSLILLGILVISCASLFFIGIKTKDSGYEKMYVNFTENGDISGFSPAMYSYKDVYTTYEKNMLRNTGSQLQMNSCYYENDDLMVYSVNDGKTYAKADGNLFLISDGLATDINVIGGDILFRDIDLRELMIYDMDEKKSHKTGINDARRVMCAGEKCYYISIPTSSLIRAELDLKNSEILIADDVADYFVLGELILYLDKNNSLHIFNSADGNDKVIEKNVSSFLFDGMLWMNVNGRVYSRKLDEASLKKIDIPCDVMKLHGISDNRMIYSSSDGIYIYDIENYTNEFISDDIFIGASDDMEKVLVYERETKKYTEIVPFQKG